MANQNRKQRRKHLQPQVGTEQKDKQLISELNLAAPKENRSVVQENTRIGGFLRDYRAYRQQRENHTDERGRASRKRLGVLGMLAVLFAVIGVIASVQFAVRAGVSIANQDKLKQKLTPYLSAYVVTDVPEFSDYSGLSQVVKQRLAAWQLLLDADLSLYPSDEYGNLFVPAEDVNGYAKRLFGEDAVLQPRSDYGGALALTYDDSNGCYLLPLQPDYATYYPNIVDIEKERGGYVLKVQYMAADMLVNLKPTSQGTVIKTMQYHLLETPDGFRVISVKLLSIEADGYYQPDSSVSSEPASDRKDAETEDAPFDPDGDAAHTEA